MIQLVVSAMMLLAVAALVKDIELDGAFSAGLAAIVLGVANAIVKPVLVLLSLPITVLTLGLFLLVINGFVLYGVSAVVPGFRIKRFGAALMGALWITVFNVVIGAFTGG